MKAAPMKAAPMKAAPKKAAVMKAAPMKAAVMKAAAMKGGPLSKSGIAEALAEATELKKSDCMKVLTSMAEVAAKEVKGTGKFTLPGLCMVKTRVKPATKAGNREVFGKVIMVKAKPAKTVVKAFCVSALKKAV